MPFAKVHAFTRGMIEADLIERDDAELYRRAARDLTNVVVSARGPVATRGAWRRVGTADPGRIVPHIFNRDQSYLIRLADEAVTVYEATAEIGVWTASAPWAIEQLPDIDWVQYADTMLIVHEAVPERRLTRLSATTWGISLWPWSNLGRPQVKFAPDSVTLSVTTVSAGVVELTASASVFLSPGTTGVQIINDTVEPDVIVDGATNAAACFDGTLNAPVAESAVFAYDDLPGFIGLDRGIAPRAIAAARVYPAGDLGLADLEWTSITLALYGSADAPTDATDGTLLGSLDVLQALEAPRQTIGYFEVASTDAVTAWRYTWVAVTEVLVGEDPPSTSLRCFISEVQFLAPVATTASHVGSYVRVNEGYAQVTQVLSGTVARGAYLVGIGSPNPTADWAEDATSAARGYVRLVGFFGNRLALVPASRPSTVFLSRANGEFDFRRVVDVTEDDAAPVDWSLLGDALNEIVKIRAASGALVLFTTDEEWTNVADAVTPKTPPAVSRTNFGASPIKPLNVDGAMLFVAAPETDGAVIELQYDAVVEGFRGTDLTKLVPSVTNAPVAMVYRRGAAGESRYQVCVANGDGSVAVLTTLRDEEVTAWSIWRSELLVRDLAVTGDKLWALCQRGTDWSLQVLDDDAWFDDSTILTADDPTTEWAVPERYADGTELRARADDKDFGTLVVADGQIVIPEAETEIEIGLPWDWRVTPLPPVSDPRLQAPENYGLEIHGGYVTVEGARVVRVNGVDIIDPVIGVDAFGHLPLPRTGRLRFSCDGAATAVEITGPGGPPAKVVAVGYHYDWVRR